VVTTKQLYLHFVHTSNHIHSQPTVAVASARCHKALVKYDELSYSYMQAIGQSKAVFPSP